MNNPVSVPSVLKNCLINSCIASFHAKPATKANAVVIKSEDCFHD